MRFYFHMSGDGIGTLGVFRISQGHLHLLLNLTGDQGNYWQMREIPLSDIWDFQVMFEGKVGRNPKGDICLDDITFTPGCLMASPAGEVDDTPPPAGMQPQSLFMFNHVGMILHPPTEHLLPKPKCGEPLPTTLSQLYPNTEHMHKTFYFIFSVLFSR